MASHGSETLALTPEAVRGRHRPDRPAEMMHQFLSQAGTTAPDKAAILEQTVDGGLRGVSYLQLAERTELFANTLGECGIGVGDRVVIESATSAAAIALLAACSTVGATFIPLSPEVPAARRTQIVESAEPALYLRSSAANGDENEIPDRIGFGRFDLDAVKLERDPPRRARHRTDAVCTDPAYIVFTSGSTGRPKGVVMSHRGYLAFCRGMLAQDICTEEDRVASTSPFQFDFSLLDIGLALGSRATLVPVPRAALRWPRRFARFLRETGATHVNGVPSIWRWLVRLEPDLLADLTAVRSILFSGERFPLRDVRALRQALPGLRIVNCFGSTESIACAFGEVPDPIPPEMRDLPIGRAHQGAEIHLIDRDGRAVDEPGIVGEIYLRSPALFTGYWDDPAATAAALVPDPLEPRSGQVLFRSGDLASRGRDGRLYFHGRTDSMVKISGNRVELGAVERRLREHPALDSAAVLVSDPDGGAEPELAAFVVPAPGSDAPSASELRAFCALELPEYMVPQHLRVIERLPLNGNGKLDRAALTGLLADRPEP